MEKVIVFLALCAIVLAVLNFRNRKKAVFLETIIQIPFKADWKTSVKLAETSWDAIVDSQFDDVVKREVSRKVTTTLKEAIESETCSSDGMVTVIKGMSLVGQSNSPLSTTVTLSAKDFFETSRSMHRFSEKVVSELWMQPLGKKMVFIASLLPDEGKSPFLIEIIISMRYFEWNILRLIEYDVRSRDTFAKKSAEFTSEEKAAARKISAFYRLYDSLDHETEDTTKSLARLFEHEEQHEHASVA